VPTSVTFGYEITILLYKGPVHTSLSIDYEESWNIRPMEDFTP